MKKLLFIPLLFICSVAYAAPTGLSLDTTLTESFHNTRRVVSGTGFGTKSTAAPQVWDNFETGTISSSRWDNPYSMATTTSNQRNGNSGYCVTGDMGTNWARALDEKNSVLPGYGGKAYISLWYRCGGGDNWNWTNAGWSNGYKWMRVLPSGSETDCEFAWSMVGGQGYLTCNNGNSSYSQIDSWTPRSMSVGTWWNVEFVMKTPTNTAATDATAYMYVDGSNKSGMNLDGTEGLAWWAGDGGGDISSMRAYRLGWHSNTGDIADGSYIYLDDVYIDNTWQKVMLGNQPVFANCTKKEVQIPSAWSNTSITLTMNQGSFGASDNIYLFVVDANGDVSAGLSVSGAQGGGGVADTTAPSIGGLNPYNNEINVSPAVSIIFHATDEASGVDANSLTASNAVSVSGVSYASQLQVTGTKSDYTCTLTNATLGNFDPGEIVTVATHTHDLSENSVINTWDFTIEDNQLRLNGQTLTLNGQTLTL